jgi:hypothetical protein
MDTMGIVIWLQKKNERGGRADGVVNGTEVILYRWSGLGEAWKG